MKLRKTLTNLVCSSLAVAALQGDAKAGLRVEFTPSFGVVDSNMEKGERDKWHELQMNSTLNANMEVAEGSWAYSGNVDLIAQGVRYGEPLKLRTEKMTVLAGRIYPTSEERQFQLLGGVDGRFTSTKTGIIAHGAGDNSYFYNDREGSLNGNMVGLAISPRWIIKTDVSDKTYQLIGSIGSGKAEEEIVHFFKGIMHKGRIKYNEASVGGMIHSKKLVKREPGRGRPSFLAWTELELKLKASGQFGGYNNLTIESEILHAYPAATSFDLFAAVNVDATVYGVKPEDITTNGNRIFGWSLVGGFRLKRF